MIIVSQIKTNLNEHAENAVKKALSACGLSDNEVKSAKIYKSSVDARHGVCFVNSVIIELVNGSMESRIAEKYPNVRIFSDEPLSVNFGDEPLNGEICIAGFGPAGMFCALTLCEFGYKPIVFERGASMDDRIKAVEKYWNGGVLDEQTNVQFGEGGAGTFSDGKLTTRINDPLCARVLEKFVESGAPREILTKAKPHIGTDNLREIVVNLRKKIIALGGEVRFLSPIEEIGINGGRVRSVTVKGSEIPCGALVLAVGHSAHDTFGMLQKNSVDLQPKAFSVGVRIEHLQADMDRALYGKYAGHPALPPSEYSLSFREASRGVYTFCMCPGGFVVGSSSDIGRIVTNGMSQYSRSGINANSAVLVSVTPDDFGNSPLSGIDFIKGLEEKAFAMGKFSGRAPVMLTREFVNGSGKSLSLGRVTPTYLPGTEPANLRELFPEHLSDFLSRGIAEFGKKIRGFSDNDSVLTGVESRTSSPVKIPRSDGGCSQNADGLYPCGEGAGYAGGIMSAAVDGIKIAVKIMERFRK